MGTYDLGQRFEVAVAFTNVETGAAVDPAVVRLKIRRPNLAITTRTHPHSDITKDDTGLYTTSILGDRPGRWLVFWIGESSNEAVAQTTIHVNGSEFYDADGDELPDS